MAERLTLKELQEAYKKEAKRADQRMRELEKRSTTEEFKAAMKWAYARAQDDLSALFGENVTRFDRKIKDRRKLNKAMAAVTAFLNSPTSTIREGKELRGIGGTPGIIDLYEKRKDQFNAWIDKNIARKDRSKRFTFTTESFKDFVQNQEYQKAREAYGSAVLLKTIANRMKQRNKIVKMIREEENRQKDRITNQEVYERIIQEINEKGFSAARDLM